MARQPKMTVGNMPLTCLRFILQLSAVLLLSTAGIATPPAADDSQGLSGDAEEKIWIHHIQPDPRGGRAYKLVYVVPVAIDIHWAFKTDFDNDFLVENKYITAHRFGSRVGNTVTTENKYANGPNVFFKWRTTVDTEARRLEFVLTNPEECHQKFHYGHIQLEAVQAGTRVTQVAFFDFLGVSLWAAYPWLGGMKDFLSYTARWEMKTVYRLRKRYSDLQLQPTSGSRP